MSGIPPTDPQDFSESPYQPPVAVPKPHDEGDATGGVIPYKNPHALIAYYLGIFSMLPCIGLLLAIPAVILGVMGLRKRAQNPVIKGSVHAWIGILCGGLFMIIWTLVLAAMVLGMASG